MKRLHIIIALQLLSSTAFSQLQVLNDGKVGIGTLIPKEALQIGNSLTIHDGGAKALAYNFYHDVYDRRLIGGRSNAIYLGPGDIEFRVAGTGTANSTISWATPLKVFNNGISVRHSYNGMFFSLVAGGPVYCASGGYWNASDASLKENIQPIDNALSKVLKLQGKSYYYIQPKDSELSSTEKVTYFGLLAQDVKVVIPELVMEVDDASKTSAINYDGFIPLLIEAIKEQQIIIDALKTEVEALKLK
jgi:hypothetical protein